MNRDELKLEWWKLACELHPSPVSFIDINGKFLFCNNSFCELTGYSETELKELTWEEITKGRDYSGDKGELVSVVNGTKEDFYLEKTYIRKDCSEVLVSIYVHKYPEFGKQEGYVVFSRILFSKEYQDLRDKFFDLQKTVLVMQQSALSTETLLRRMDVLDNEIKHNREISQALIGKNSISIGDRVGGDSTGRDKITNQSTLILVMSVVLGIVVLGFFALVLSGSISLGYKDSTVNIQGK